MKLHFPRARDLPDSGPAYGQEVTAPENQGWIDDGLIATQERLAVARQYWLQAKAEDFEKTGRRTWRDLASGLEHRQVDGCPLLSPSVEEVSCWFLRDGKFVFLTSRPEEIRTIIHGRAHRGGEVRDGRIVWTE